MFDPSAKSEPLGWVRYLNAARGGGTEVCRLPIERVRSTLPPGLEAIVCASDLQGVVTDAETGESQLLGVAVVDALLAIADEGRLAPLGKCGALLAGDLYSVPEASKRGGFGDVRPVWAAFSRAFRWVAGVAGNHDDVRRVSGLPNAHLLDLDRVTLDGLTIAGVGLIAGNPGKPGRRSLDDQLAGLELACEGRPDVLLLHEGPRCGDRRGSREIFDCLSRRPPALTVCGHDHWESPRFDGPPRVLNVCERVVVLAP